MAAVGVALAEGVTREGVRPGDRVRVRIRALAAGGAGVADLPDGRVVFVHRTAPGDKADVRVERLKRRWAEARLESLVESGPGRAEPPCRLYGECGGCTLQHVDYERQLAWKGRFVADALTRIGGIPCDPPPVDPSPARIHYRNRVTFTVRTLPGGRTVAGFRALGRPDRVVDVRTECVLPERAILRTWRDLRAAWEAGVGSLPPATELRLTLRTVADGVVATVTGGPPGWDPSGLSGHVRGLVGMWHRTEGTRQARLVQGAPGHDTFLGRVVPLGGGAFLQVNRSAAEGLVRHVLGQAGTGDRAVDAYCGIGVYGRALARRGWRVTGIEADPEACTAARHDAPRGFVTRQGRVEDHLRDALPADLAIVNPPRGGLSDQVRGALRRDPPSRLVYVSCDPATLARDLARLGPAHRLTSLRSFDLFPQTAHVETVATLDAGPESPCVTS